MTGRRLEPPARGAPRGLSESTGGPAGGEIGALRPCAFASSRISSDFMIAAVHRSTASYMSPHQTRDFAHARSRGCPGSPDEVSFPTSAERFLQGAGSSSSRVVTNVIGRRSVRRRGASGERRFFCGAPPLRAITPLGPHSPPMVAER